MLSSMRLGMGEILIILVVALLVFGPTKLPQLGDALGRGIRNFKKAASGDDSSDDPAEPPEQIRLTSGDPVGSVSRSSAENKHA
jgi:sec-independent protein translocase protein TatA